MGISKLTAFLVFPLLAFLFYVPVSQAGEPLKQRIVVEVAQIGPSSTNRAVASLGDYLFIGDADDSEAGFSMGAVTIYRKVIGGWSFAQKLLPSGDDTGQRFGWSIAADRDDETGESRLIVGAPAVLNVNAAGRVYLYHLDNGVWGDEQVLESPLGPGGDQFGWDVAIDTAVPSAEPGLDPIWTAAVGAPQYVLPLAANSTGAVLVTRLNDLGSWTPPTPPIASEQDANPGSRLGHSVALARDLLLAGAPVYDFESNGTYIGAVHAYVRGSQLAWAANGVEPNPFPSERTGFPGDEFGFSVDVEVQAIDNGYDYVVGAPGWGVVGADNSIGRAYIYRTPGTGFVSRQPIGRPDSEVYDQFGYAVSIDKEALFGDNRIFVTSPVATGGTRSSVFEFRRPLITDQWDAISEIKVKDEGTLNQSNATIGRDIDVRDGQLAVTVSGRLYSNEVPLFVATFGG